MLNSECGVNVTLARCIALSGLLFIVACSPAIRQIAPRTDEFRSMEKRAFELINDYRQSRGLKILVWSDIISNTALKHSEKMASNRVQFSHVGFDYRMKEISERMQVRSSSENIGVNWGYQDPVQHFVDGWINSPGHHENIVGNYNLTGVGIARSLDGSYYATQIFVLNR